MKLVFVHGWSVTDTETYAGLPEALMKLASDDLNLEIQHLYLGRYISFNDAVTLDDIAFAFESARLRELEGETFSVITHSTGGPVIRNWLARFFDSENMNLCPIQHLVMLAPANHGSALAQIGKSRISRLASWFSGVEPGQKVLDWLELGSDGQYELNTHWLQQESWEAGPYPFVLTGESIDKTLYDYVNSYTAEKGSDGVVRVASANMNFTHLKLHQQDTQCNSFNGECVSQLAMKAGIQTATPCAFEIIPRASHSQSKMGIMNSVTKRNASRKPVVSAILQCLSVDSVSDYEQVSKLMAQRSNMVKRKASYNMLVVRVTDDHGHRVTDFDLFLLSGKAFHPGQLPSGFMLDKQKNSVNGNCITLYLDSSKLLKIADGKLGFKIIARPDTGFSYYQAAEYHCEDISVHELIKADQTLMLDIVLKRHIHKETFSLVNTELSGPFDSLTGFTAKS
ncbi:triacylglycerol lipase [Shewanella sp. UCD-KL12]|uniref:esterase/lipase family protein n=1 Tax=Shewanella sp. UCD-KL12 TaxID=1917163 RepID=UPI0009709E73|nr:alpha/beta hydrolase [Shewanella sp. UCD-KL12]